MPDAETVRMLSSSRWFVPALALVHREDGARYAVLLKRLGLSRSMLRRTLDRLVRAGWIARNRGHGHPLRPEYVETPEGRPIGAWCAGVMAARERLGLEPGDLGRWALPILIPLQAGERRFSELEAALAPVTPRALSLALKQLLARDLIERRLEDSFPPAALYLLTGRGKVLAEAMSPS